MMFETDVESTAVHALVCFVSHRMIKRIVLAGYGPFCAINRYVELCAYIYLLDDSHTSSGR